VQLMLWFWILVLWFTTTSWTKIYGRQQH
jgi:hypothetical protein